MTHITRIDCSGLRYLDTWQDSAGLHHATANGDERTECSAPSRAEVIGRLVHNYAESVKGEGDDAPPRLADRIVGIIIWIIFVVFVISAFFSLIRRA